LKAETKLNRSQISAKDLINFMPNYFLWAEAIVNAELGNNIAEISAKKFPFCVTWSAELNSVQAQSQNAGIPSYNATFHTGLNVILIY